MSTKDRLDIRAKDAVLLGFLVCLSWPIGGCSRSSADTSSTASSTSTPTAPPPAPPAGAEELALVAPLVVGGSLGDFEVIEVQALQKGVLNIVCRKGRSIVRLWIALASEKGPEPPAQMGKYAVFYSVRSGDPADAERLAKALAEIVGKHSDVPVPKGMTEFVPAPIPL